MLRADKLCLWDMDRTSPRTRERIKGKSVQFTVESDAYGCHCRPRPTFWVKPLAGWRLGSYCHFAHILKPVDRHDAGIERYRKLVLLPYTRKWSGSRRHLSHSVGTVGQLRYGKWDAS